MNDNQEISANIQAAISYKSHLNSLLVDIQTAEEQICNTSEHTQQDIQEAFKELTTTLVQKLDDRKNALIDRVIKTRTRSLQPLEECRSDITKRISRTDQFINQGGQLLNGREKNFAQFTKRSSFLGSLPEIPELTEVPYLTFQYEPSVKKELVELCEKFGEVSRIAPVQISETTEKPGGILVEWQVSENDDRTMDIQEFRLQRAFGNVSTEPHLEVNFSDCFIGLDNQYLVKELIADQQYSFRVCCKFEGSNQWSPWSLPQICATTLPSFCWEENLDYFLADGNRIATPTKNEPSLLLSRGAQFSIGHSVEFTFLEYDSSLVSLALIVKNAQKPTTIKNHSQDYFALDSSGEIYVNGVKKSTKLPTVSKGFKVCFTWENSNNHSRINIDACDKRVTYDWNISNLDKLYFAAQFQSPNNKIMVE